MQKTDWRDVSSLPALTLAYIGDAVFELGVRRYFLDRGTRRAEELHVQAVSCVKAKFQSRFYHYLEPRLSGEELQVMKRGRNAKSGHQPKNSDISDYRRASGVEALFGALWLGGREERLRELFAELYVFIEKEEDHE